MPATQLRRIDEEPATESGEQEMDRRDSPREPARDLADIVTDPSRQAMTCMVRNVSGTGALIEAGTREVPDRFVLINHARKFRSVCRVVWRRGAMMGVRFLTPPRKFQD